MGNDNNLIMAYAPPLHLYYPKSSSSPYIYHKSLPSSLMHCHELLNSEEEMQKERKRFADRCNKPGVVQGKYLSFEQVYLGGTSRITADVYYERCIGNLSQFKEIPFQDIAHFYRNALVGFDHLISLYGPFYPHQSMFHLTESRELKVWPSENIGSYNFKLREITEAEMLKRVIEILERNGDPKCINMGLGKRIQIASTFKQATLKLSLFCQQNRIEIHDKITCLEGFKTEQLWNLLNQQNQCQPQTNCNPFQAPSIQTTEVSINPSQFVSISQSRVRPLHSSPSRIKIEVTSPSLNQSRTRAGSLKFNRAYSTSSISSNFNPVTTKMGKTSSGIMRISKVEERPQTMIRKNSCPKMVINYANSHPSHRQTQSNINFVRQHPLCIQNQAPIIQHQPLSIQNQPQFIQPIIQNQSLNIQNQPIIQNPPLNIQNQISNIQIPVNSIPPRPVSTSIPKQAHSIPLCITPVIAPAPPLIRFSNIPTVQPQIQLQNQPISATTSKLKKSSYRVPFENASIINTIVSPQKSQGQSQIHKIYKVKITGENGVVNEIQSLPCDFEKENNNGRVEEQSGFASQQSPRPIEYQEQPKKENPFQKKAEQHIRKPSVFRQLYEDMNYEEKPKKFKENQEFDGGYDNFITNAIKNIQPKNLASSKNIQNNSTKNTINSSTITSKTPKYSTAISQNKFYTISQSRKEYAFAIPSDNLRPKITQKAQIKQDQGQSNQFKMPQQSQFNQFSQNYQFNQFIQYPPLSQFSQLTRLTQKLQYPQFTQQPQQYKPRPMPQTQINKIIKETSENSYLFTDPDLYKYLTNNHKATPLSLISPNAVSHRQQSSQTTQTEEILSNNQKIQFKEVQSRYGLVQTMKSIQQEQSLECNLSSINAQPKQDQNEKKEGPKIDYLSSLAQNIHRYSFSKYYEAVPDPADVFPSLTDISQNPSYRDDPSFMAIPVLSHFKRENYAKVEIDQRIAEDLRKLAAKA